MVPHCCQIQCHVYTSVHACVQKLEKMAEEEQAQYRKEIRAYKLEQKRREAEVIYKPIIFFMALIMTQILNRLTWTKYIVIRPITQSHTCIFT